MIAAFPKTATQAGSGFENPRIILLEVVNDVREDVTETPFFFVRDDAQLFGMTHLPDGPVRSTAYVCSHPFGEEKLWSHRVLVSFARALARKGHIVLRFDYSGAGDSSGQTADSGLTTHRADLAAAIGVLEKLRPEITKVGLIGLRLGATIAALTAEHCDADSRLASLRDAPLVLWDPILDGEGYIQELLRSNLSTQLAFYGKVKENREVLTERIRNGGTVNVDGYELGKPLLDSYGTKELLDSEPKKHSGATLITQIAATNSQKEREDLSNLASSYRNGTFARTVEQPFWREIRKFYGNANELQEATLVWLEQADG
jgi:pimeloyl-ACP methyl ester carboxylesterase